VREPLNGRNVVELSVCAEYGAANLRQVRALHP
jgi:hypothetical protein